VAVEKVFINAYIGSLEIIIVSNVPNHCFLTQSLFKVFRIASLMPIGSLGMLIVLKGAESLF
jgi:hypothetical protein